MSNEMIELLIKSFWETGYMVVASTVLASLIGIPLGIILTVTRSGHILPNAVINSVLGVIVNATPFHPVYYFNGSHYSAYPYAGWFFHRHYGRHCAAYHFGSAVYCARY